MRLQNNIADVGEPSRRDGALASSPRALTVYRAHTGIRLRCCAKLPVLPLSLRGVSFQPVAMSRQARRFSPREDSTTRDAAHRHFSKFSYFMGAP